MAALTLPILDVSAEPDYVEAGTGGRQGISLSDNSRGDNGPQHVPDEALLIGKK